MTARASGTESATMYELTALPWMALRTANAPKMRPVTRPRTPSTVGSQAPALRCAPAASRCSPEMNVPIDPAAAPREEALVASFTLPSPLLFI